MPRNVLLTDKFSNVKLSCGYIVYSLIDYNGGAFKKLKRIVVAVVYCYLYRLLGKDYDEESFP